MDPVIRNARPEDVQDIQRVARRTWHAAYDDLLGADAVDEQVDEWYADESVREGIEREDNVYLVAEVDAVLGYAVAGRTVDTTAGLHAIYVGPDHWRAGIGSALFDATTEWLCDHGMDRLRIHVFAGNDVGRSFYESRGFDVVDRGSVQIAGKTLAEVVYGGEL